MAASTAPGVKKKLLELLEENQATAGSMLEGVQLRYEHPGATIQQEAIYFNKTVETEKPAAIGQLRQEESYFFEVIVDVVQDGDNGQIAEERCWAIIGVLETLIRERERTPFGGVNSGWILYEATEMTPHIEAGQRLAEAICRIRVVSRK